MNQAPACCSAPRSACHLDHVVADGPRPVWAVLEAAAASNFSGRLTLALPVPVDVHFLHGEIYLAERDTDPDLGQRLIDMEVLDADQLARGTVRVGNTTTLGRLFDRVPELDPHRLELALEMITEAALAPVNDDDVEQIDVVHRAHHPSGVVRWLSRATGPATAPAPAAPAPPAPAAATPTQRPPVVEAAIEPVVEAAVEPVVEAAAEPVVEPAVEPVVEPVDDHTIADPESAWLRSLEPVSRMDDPVMAVVAEPPAAPLVAAGRPSIPAPPAAPIHDLMADLDLRSILAKVASPDGPPLGESTEVSIVWAPSVTAPASPSADASTVPTVPTVPTLPTRPTLPAIDTEIHAAVNQALAGIESATRRDEVVDQYLGQQPVPMAPTPAQPTLPTLPAHVPTLPIAPLSPLAPPRPTMPLAPASVPEPPAPATLEPATWSDTPAFTTLSLGEGIPITPSVTNGEPVKSGGFRRLIGGGNR
jgi:hypothetical protein